METFVRKSRLKMHPKRSKLISSSWNLLQVSLILLHVFDFTRGQDEPATTAIVPFIPSAESGKSGSATCSPLKVQDGKNAVSCKGHASIPTDIKEKFEIHILDMSPGNHIQTLTAGQLSKAGLVQLNTLTLQNCQILTIERGAFQTDVQYPLQTLDLSKNRIEVLNPEVFANMNSLRSLILRENPIHRFYEGVNFPPLLGLTTLDFSSCKLDNFPVNTLEKLINLEKLLLKNNSLSTLNWRVVQQARALNTLEVAENPWFCDCHIKFLIDVLKEKAILLTLGQTTCTKPDVSPQGNQLSGVKWASVQPDDLICSPEIKKLMYLHYDVVPISKTSDNHKLDDDDGVKLGQDVHFECEYSGYEKPDVRWIKITNGKKFTLSSAQVSSVESAAESVPGLSERKTNDDGSNNKTVNSDSLPNAPRSFTPTQKPKLEFQQGTFNLLKNLDEEGKKRNYDFREHLIVRRVEPDDAGEYVCSVVNLGGRAEKSVYLNLTRAAADDLHFGGIGGKKVAIWIWVLVGLMCVLIIVLALLVVAFIWKKRDKRKQEGFRKVLHEKFKDSNVDLGELENMKITTTPQTQQKDPNRPEGSTPLLDSKSDSTVVVSDIPDVALGNAELVRNSQIFSPKPPPAHGHAPDSRKEFFARQLSDPHLMRPVSAMSLTRPYNVTAAQRRYIYANSQSFQSAPVPGMNYSEPVYAMPEHIRQLPRSGSAMSMTALPESDLRRQLFMRQYSQPSYATASRIPPRNRNPSITSEPPQDMMGAYNYSTLPRRFNRYQTWSRPGSPTNSTCSSYSTLSWRPAPHPVTGVISDGIGKRSGADGGSSLSLNQIPDASSTAAGSSSNSGIESMNRAMSMNPSYAAGKIPRNPRLGHSRTPNSLTRGHNDFFSFEPIQEVEGAEGTSNLNLENLGGLQVPGTQSLARGEPRYKKKKPPPISVIPVHLKQPSKAFEHLKGRSVSPGLNQNVDNVNSDKTKVTQNEGSGNIEPPYQKVGNDQNGNAAPVLESTIDEALSDMYAAIQNLGSPDATSKPAPPPPPPKPKRSHQNLDSDQDAEDNGNVSNAVASTAEDNKNNNSNGIKVVISDGTEV